jgi:hypothetical protein
MGQRSEHPRDRSLRIREHLFREEGALLILGTVAIPWMHVARPYL